MSKKQKLEQTASVEDAQTVAERTVCRGCEGVNLQAVWSFGATPLANNYLAPAEVGQPELMVPLTVDYCDDCHLMQLHHIVSPHALFDHYLYVSSTSPSFVAHFEAFATELIQRFKLTHQDLVVDVGSNDGVLLRPLKERNVRVLGVDPAANVADAANEAGIPTETAYFTPEIVAGLRSKYGPASVITANNVFAHTDRIDEFAQAVKHILAPNGAFVFEVQYLGDLVDKNLFDIVYHEHMFYYHLTPLVHMLGRFGLSIFDVERPDVHGGSLRVYAQHAGGPHAQQPNVGALLQREELAGLNKPATYNAFATRIDRNKRALRKLVNDIKKDGKTIAAYGAPAKATTLMYTFGLTRDDITFIVDDAPLKQGRVMPGTHVPIVSSEQLYQIQPEYCLIMAWNFAEPIMKNHEKYAELGGKWIVPIPEPQVA